MDNKILAVYILNNYIWNILQQNNAPISLVNGAIPIVPVLDAPQLAEEGRPYIIYGYAEQFTTGMPEVRTGTLSLRITAGTYSELGEIMTTIARTFEELDVSASHVNEWSSNNQSFVGIRFTSVSTTYVSADTAPDAEGGMYDGTVNITYRYVSHQQVKQYSNGTWA